MIRETPVKEIMVSRVISVYEDDPFSLVEEKLRLNKIRHLPVIDRTQKLVGIVTQRDLYHTVAPRKTEEGDYYDPAQLNTYILKHIMTPKPLSLKPGDSIAYTIELFANFKYGCLPIVAPDGTLLGIVTQIDVLKYIARRLKTAGNI